MSEPAIRTLDLTKRFGSLVALDHLTLDVEQGEVFGFLGPNGAGKSTTLRLLLGFIRAHLGIRDRDGNRHGAMSRRATATSPTCPAT